MEDTALSLAPKINTMEEDRTGNKSNRHAIFRCKGRSSEIKVGTGRDKPESHSGRHPSWVTYLIIGPVITLLGDRNRNFFVHNNAKDL